MIPKCDQDNFNTIIRAAKNNNLCLLETTRISDGKQVSLICAVNFVNEQYEMVPLAVMVEDNPYEIFTPPTLSTDKPDDKMLSWAADLIEQETDQHCPSDSWYRDYYMKLAARIRQGPGDKIV
jgi:hypothetical protein